MVLRKLIHSVAKVGAALPVLFNVIQLYQLATGYVGNGYAKVAWLDSWSDSTDVETFLFALVILIVGGLGALWRTRLGFFIVAAGYVVLTMSYAHFLATEPRPIPDGTSNRLIVFPSAALFFGVAGFLENDSMRKTAEDDKTWHSPQLRL